MNMVTIPQCGALGPIPAYRLRAMLKQGKLQGLGFFSGSRYYLDRDKLLLKLEDGSLEALTDPEEAEE